MAIEINNYADLQAMSALLSGDYILMADIDATAEADWVPVGALATPFTGEFDGNGKTITGLHFTTTSGYQGLFGTIANGALVKKVGLINVKFNATGTSGSRIGGIAGHCFGPSLPPTIEECYVTGGLSGYDLVGGIVGQFYDEDTTIQNCWANVCATNVSYQVGCVAGGGSSDHPKLRNCYGMGTSNNSSGDSAGGLIGNTSRPQDGNNPIVSNCFAGAVINASGSPRGGVIGRGEILALLPTYSINNGWFTNAGGDAVYAVGYINQDVKYETATLSSFYDKNYGVYDIAAASGWDFDTIWLEQDGALPILQWQLPIPPVLVDKTTYNFTITH